MGPLTSGWASAAGLSAGFPTSPALSPLSIHPREHISGELLATPGSSGGAVSEDGEGWLREVRPLRFLSTSSLAPGAVRGRKDGAE